MLVKQNIYLRIVGQNSNDRPDLCCRVFRLKLKELLRDLYKKQIFGNVIARIHVIEFQKRGVFNYFDLLKLICEIIV